MPSRLYCVGGKNPSNNFQITEYNSSTQKWSQVYRFNQCRLNFGITSIGSRIYMMGGQKSWRIKHSLEVFDCQTGKFDRLKKARLKKYYSGCALGAVGDTLFVSGGKIRRYETKYKYGYNSVTKEYEDQSVTYSWVEPTDHAYSCDLSADKPRWTKIRSMDFSDAGHTMIEHRGALYSIGCENGWIQRYRPIRDDWGTVGEIRKENNSSVSAALHPAENVIYILGETFFEMFAVDEYGYDRVQGPPMDLPPNSRASSLVCYDGKLLAIGGCSPGEIEKLTTVSEFDTRNRKWIPFSGLDVPRKRHSCVVVNY